MQKDFHYYATYCAAILAGHSHQESLDIAYSAQFVDCCSGTYLAAVHGPLEATTTQLQLELMDAGSMPWDIQNMTRIWSSFHFLPYDLYATRRKCSKRYLEKYRLICGPNGDLLVETVENARNKSLQAVGIAMHILADTWAHGLFAGTPSLVINNVNYQVTEILPEGFVDEDGNALTERPVHFVHNPSAPDDLDKGKFVSSVFQSNEQSIMNLGHGRAGHLPDYSFMRYKLLPAWMDYKEVTKDNPKEYMYAFCQMVYAMRRLIEAYGTQETHFFVKDTYDFQTVEPWREQIQRILVTRQLDSCDDWKALGERISGHEIPDFDIDRYRQEYEQAPEAEKENTFLGKFFSAAIMQKSMVTSRIFESGSILAGFPNGMGKKELKKMMKSVKKDAEMAMRED